MDSATAAEDAIVPDFGKVMANPVEPIACRFRSTGHINTVNVRYVAVDVSA